MKLQTMNKGEKKQYWLGPTAFVNDELDTR